MSVTLGAAQDLHLAPQGLFRLRLGSLLCRHRSIWKPLGKLFRIGQRIIHQKWLSPIGNDVVSAVKRPMGYLFSSVYIKTDTGVVEILPARRSNVKCRFLAAVQKYPVPDDEGRCGESANDATVAPDS